MKITCKQKGCNNKFEPRAVGKCIEKKYCSRTCGMRYISLKRYNKLKNNTEYKRKHKEYFEKWRKINREHFNDLVREPNRIHSAKVRLERNKKGLCPRCGKKRDSKFKTCLKCREKQRERYWR